MTYPRCCPLCEVDYRGPSRGRAEDLWHATLRAEPGGTPSPRWPGLPGRLLTLRCTVCRGEYAWDYFAGRPAAGEVTEPVGAGGAPSPRRRWVAR
jgi:hypothetical protein